MEGLSIIILNYNTYQTTCDCIQSIYDAQIQALDLEIILVDNGSSEIEPVPFTMRFPNIHYVKSHENLGFAKGNNLGIQQATKPYLLLLNSDTLITDPYTFVKCLSKLHEFNDQIVLTPRLVTDKGISQMAYGALPDLLSEWMFTTFMYKLLSPRQKQKRSWQFVPGQNRLIKKGYITATFFLFAASMLEKLTLGKLYDETFLYGEELFWAVQCDDAGYGLFYFAEVSVIHLVGHSASKTDSHKIRTRRAYQVAGEYQFMCWRYRRITVLMICFLRLCRFAMLSPFDADIRLRFNLLLKQMFK